MEQKNISEFKYACKKYLDKRYGLNELRAYARSIGVESPTKRKSKEELLDEIVCVLAGEIPPVPQSKRGAPVVNAYFNPQIEIDVEELRMRYLYAGQPHKKEKSRDDEFQFAARYAQAKKDFYYLSVNDPQKKPAKEFELKKIYKGQLETLNGVPILLPLNCVDSDKKVVVSIDLVRVYDLREGDVITCYAEKRQHYLIATSILTVNEYVVESYKRGKFEEFPVSYPKIRMNFYKDGTKGTITSKLFQWLIPIGKGQRGLVVSQNKTGKSTLLVELAREAIKENDGLCVLALLVDQSPENINQFKDIIKKDDLLFTTYEDEVDRQVFVAEFIMKRAKRFAEMGRDVLLLVDSFNALAHAFNNTDASVGGKTLAGGMESKTIQYVKRYFGMARCLENSGTITILGALSVDTGNPADDLLKSELSTISNLEIHLSSELAKRRVYPALDLMSTLGRESDIITNTGAEIFDSVLRNQFLPVHGLSGLYEIISTCSNYEDFETKIYKQVKDDKK